MTEDNSLKNFDELEYQSLINELCSIAKANNNKIENSLVGEIALDYNYPISQLHSVINDIESKGYNVIVEDYNKIDNDNQDFTSIDGVTIFLNEISKKPLLTYSQEVELARKIQKGDLEAKNKLIECNLRLVVFIAKKYRNSGLPFEDLISDGNIGLITAAVKFNPDVGCRFSTYATYWIRQSITRDISEHLSIIYMPAYIGDLIKKMRRMEQNLEQSLGRAPTETELAATLSISVAELRELQLVSLQPRSIYEEVGNDGNSILLDSCPDKNAILPEKIVEDEYMKKFIDDMLRTLSPREMAVIKLRFGLNDGVAYTLDAVGKMFNVSRERIRQIEIKALKKLQRMQVLKKIKAYVF